MITACYDENMKALSNIFPINSDISVEGHLVIDGCDVVDLMSEYGSPLYICSEKDLRSRCGEFISAFRQDDINTKVIYAGKSWLNKAILKIIHQEGLGLDTVSSGEIEIALAAGFPMEEVYFHGNNKSDSELLLALESGVARIVVDSKDELNRLKLLAAREKLCPNVLLRIKPGIDPHTHAKISTGNIDSKFGFSINEASSIIPSILSDKNLKLRGFHYHIGSQIFDIQPFLDAATTTITFMADIKSRYGFITEELDIGGGYAVKYLSSDNPPDITEYAESITNHIIQKCAEHKLDLPKLAIEPGRALMARSTVALYTVGVIKEIPDIRTYICVDGGMADNIRPTLYEAKYEPYLANKMHDQAEYLYTVAGRYCESGDILASDVKLPLITTGDILVIPVCGAYCLPLASNYNASVRPAVVMINDGNHRLIRRRETIKDLLRCDMD